MNECELKARVLVAGAGPAGVMCAYLLHRQGTDCLLVDQAVFPRDKVCGGGLTSKAWHLLDALMPGLQYDYNSVSHLRLLVDGRPLCEFDAAEELRIVRRKVFDHTLLLRYQEEGGRFMQGGVLRFEERADGHIDLLLKSGQRIECDYLVGADGANSAVRRCLTGGTDSSKGILAMEQYVDHGEKNEVVVGLSRDYAGGGYYFRFPNREFDVVGYGDRSTTPERFRNVLTGMGVAPGKVRGAHISYSIDYPLHDRVILIGDAGGFANRVTCEGLYDAFLTARNACEAITTGQPFGKVNRAVFRKMRRETLFAKFFFSRAGFVLLRLLGRFTRLGKWCFDTKMKRESFIPSA